MNLKRVLVVPDIHIPFHDKRAINLVEQRMTTFKPDMIIMLGDLLDFPTLHKRATDEVVQAMSSVISRDYETAQKILKRWKELSQTEDNLSGAKIILLEGNHEDRVNRLLRRQPDLVGSLEVPLRLKGKSVNFTWVPSWSKSETFQVGKANFCHGFSAARSHVNVMGRDFGDNIFYGHTHDFDSANFRRLGRDYTYVAQSCGHLADPKKLANQWQKGRPNNWQQGWLEFYFTPQGHFQYYIIRIIKGRVILPDGTVLK